MFRRIICTLSAVLWLSAMGTPAGAAGPVGTIRVCPDWGGSMVIGGKAVLYRVGESVAGGYRLTDGLADWTVWAEEVLCEQNRNWILGMQRSEKKVETINDEQGAVFTGLTEGLYLVVQEEPAQSFLPFAPVLLRMPEGEQWEQCINPQTVRNAEPPRTGDHPAPIIGAMGLGFSVAVLMVLVDSRKK